tara:strand:- start:6080 stop:7429 length:1350 start_codon:yes stop_codon:yes gene_type:complete
MNVIPYVNPLIDDIEDIENQWNSVIRSGIDQLGNWITNKPEALTELLYSRKDLVQPILVFLSEHTHDQREAVVRQSPNLIADLLILTIRQFPMYFNTPAPPEDGNNNNLTPFGDLQIFFRNKILNDANLQNEVNLFNDDLDLLHNPQLIVNNPELLNNLDLLNNVNLIVNTPDLFNALNTIVNSENPGLLNNQTLFNALNTIVNNQELPNNENPVLQDQLFTLRVNLNTIVNNPGLLNNQHYLNNAIHAENWQSFQAYFFEGQMPNDQNVFGEDNNIDSNLIKIIKTMYILLKYKEELNNPNFFGELNINISMLRRMLIREIRIMQYENSIVGDDDLSTSILSNISFIDMLLNDDLNNMQVENNNEFVNVSDILAPGNVLDDDSPEIRKYIVSKLGNEYETLVPILEQANDANMNGGKKRKSKSKKRKPRSKKKKTKPNKKKNQSKKRK